MSIPSLATAHISRDILDSIPDRDRVPRPGIFCEGEGRPGSLQIRWMSEGSKSVDCELLSNSYER